MHAGRELLKWLAGRSDHTLPAIGLALFEKLPGLLGDRTARALEIAARLKDRLTTEIGSGVMLYPSYPKLAPLHGTALLPPIQFTYTAVLNITEMPVTQVPLGLHRGLPLGVQVAAGLHYAHERRIVHRDIKTANLFFTREKVVKIMDFGLAKTIEEVRRASTVIGGTPYYMAPEQAAGEAVDPRTDLYAFGVTLFELVTGRRPFESGDVTYQHRHTPAPDPRSLGAEMPEALAELILQLMAKQPADRPPNAEQVGQRLRALLGPAKR